jgi:hypothetical protein
MRNNIYSQPLKKEFNIMQKTKLFYSLALMLLLAQGCAFNRTVINGHVRNLDTSFIQPGKTTAWEILEQFGPPTPTPENSDERLFTDNYMRYSCMESRTTSFIITYVLYLPWRWNDTQATHETLINLDDNGVVKDVIKTRRYAMWKPLNGEGSRTPMQCTMNGREIK